MSEFDDFISLFSASNVVSYMLFGDSFNASDPRFIQYINDESENFRESASGSIVEIYPWLRFIPPYRQNFQRMKKRIERMLARLQELIDEHKKSFDPTNPRDYIDAYLVSQEAGQPSFTGISRFYKI
jgi:hypothetical protein